jgi:hypothetical protein
MLVRATAVPPRGKNLWQFAHPQPGMELHAAEQILTASPAIVSRLLWIA